MKKCFKCHETKPLSEFYKHKQMADGHLNKCKACAKNDVNKNRYKNHEHYLDYDRRRFHENEDRRKYSYDRSRQYRQSNPIKKRARYLLRNAVRDGRLVQQTCAVCGTAENIEAHHEDYSKPLEVVWLCRKHHGEAHRQLTRSL